MRPAVVLLLFIQLYAGKEDMKMLYTEKEKTEIERVRKVFADHLQQSTNFELL